MLTLPLLVTGTSRTTLAATDLRNDRSPVSSSLTVSPSLSQQQDQMSSSGSEVIF